NKRNLFTFPPRSRGLAIEGRGNAVTELRYIGWLAGAPIAYWGDLDAKGFHILSSLRAILPQTRSILMDAQTLDDCRDLTATKTHLRPEMPALLMPAEQQAFRRCCDERLWLEQERIPQDYIVRRLG
ncbi:MAG TPA: Wadjet anti-phage system protein JetD domain-containing protein, partial [Planctomycetaceae bacterium]|nr:Wadjet anti-phage system protein JetD domain-containing protein [Planctomycetaceae bacterium]